MNTFAQMTVCNDGHDEVTYTGKNCPACIMLREIEELTKEQANQHECSV